MAWTEIEFHVERDGVELELTVRGHVSAFVPAKTFGLPENCYPAEGGEVEIDAIFLNGKGWSGELTDKEKEEAEKALFECAQEDEGPDCEPDFDD